MKTKSIPVVEKLNDSNETSCASSSCDCCNCSCGCHQSSGLFKTVLLASSILGASLIIAGAIIFTSPMHFIQSTSSERPNAPAKVEASFKKFVQNNPQLILDSINKHLESKQKEAAEKEVAEPQIAPAEIVAEIVADKSNYSLGNKDGKFVIIEFFDHQCGWCKRTNAALNEAIAAKKDNGNIRWIPIDTPIFGEKSQEIARFVLAAGKQGKYAEMHHAVGEAKGLDREGLIKIGETLKLDTKKLAADADSDEIKAKLESNQKYARQLNINGVPMLIVNGKVNPGALLGDRLESALKEASEIK